MRDARFVRASFGALVAFYRGAEGKPALPARIFQPFFNALSTETQLFLARDVTTAMVAANLHVKERWGDDANIVVAGSEIRVGRGSGEAFVLLGRGRTWKAAIQDAERGPWP